MKNNKNILRIARVVLLAVVVLVLATGTIVERISPEVRIYDDWWFVALMALVGVSVVVAIVQDRMWRRPAVLMVHAAVPVILLGGAFTTWTGQQGSMTLLQGESVSGFETENQQFVQLPFSLTLEEFVVVPYPGTHTPMDFVSRVLVDGASCEISMNHILRHRGYRFYQADYGDDGSSVLCVAHDPVGIPVTYTGFALLLAGLGVMCFGRGASRFVTKAGMTVLLLLLPLSSSATPQTLPRDAADRMGRMMVLYKGRVCPLQTMAKDITTKLTGRATYQGLTPEQVMSGYLFYYDQWIDEPAIKVKGRRASMRQLMILDTVSVTPATEKSLREAVERYNLVRGLLSGRTLKLFPVADSAGVMGWYGQNDALPSTVAADEYLFIRRWQSYCQELVVMGDMAGLECVFDKTSEYQRKRTTDLPSSFHNGAERLYNTLTAGRWLAMLAVSFGLLAFLVSVRLKEEFDKKSVLRAWRAFLFFYVVMLTAYLLFVFVLRWIAGGHVPMAGGYDTMNLMAIILGFTGLFLGQKHGMALPSAMLAMGFCLLVAMMSGANPPVTNLMPVLNSPLLTMHVAVIMCSYALFFFIMLISLACLISPSTFHLSPITLLRPAVFLLALGIVIGAVWANISWGCYWSWDPKEVWALITLIIYALPLHSGILHGQRALCLYCTLAFISVVITYFGVNLILGGLHAYN